MDLRMCQGILGISKHKSLKSYLRMCYLGSQYMVRILGIAYWQIEEDLLGKLSHKVYLNNWHMLITTEDIKEHTLMFYYHHIDQEMEDK